MRKPVCLAALCMLGALGASFGSFSTVVLDAGHGGHDAGGIPSNLIPEKTVALEVAEGVQADLRDAGLRTVMTRSSDVFIPLPRRVAIANAQKNAVFVSIHFNSALRRGACGIETYYNSKKGEQLARDILRCVMTTTTGENRGVKPAKYYVLRHNRLTSVLVECGFLTNPEDTARARSLSYRHQLAARIAQGILQYRKSL